MASGLGKIGAFKTWNRVSGKPYRSIVNPETIGFFLLSAAGLVSVTKTYHETIGTRRRNLGNSSGR